MRTSLRSLTQSPGLWALAIATVVLAGLSMVRPQLGLLLILALIAGAVAIANPFARLAVLVFGALFVLGGTTEVSTAKVLYGAVAMGAALIAVANLLRDPPPWFSRARIWLGLGMALAGSMVISTVATPGTACPGSPCLSRVRLCRGCWWQSRK